MNNATTTTMHSGKRKGEDLNGSTLTPSSKQRRTAKKKAVTAMDVMTSSPPAKKAPECAIFVKEWEAFTNKHPDFQESCFLPAFWDFTKKHSDFKAKGLTALLTVPSEWLHKCIVDNEGQQLSPKALDRLLLLVAKERKELVLFWLELCKDICNGKEECTLKIPIQETPNLKLGGALLEGSKLQLVRFMMRQGSHLCVEFKIADMIFLFRESMEVDEDFADIVSLFKTNGWYNFAEDADGANGSSMPALKRSVSMDSNGSMKMYVAKPKPHGVRVKDDILGFAWALPSGYHSHWIMAERWPIGSKRRDNMERGHPVQVYGSKFDGTAEYICFATKRVICENDNIKDKEKLISDDLYTIPYMALKKDFLEHMELAKENEAKREASNGSSKPALKRSASMDSNGVEDAKADAEVDLSGKPMVYDRPIRFCDDCVKKDHPAGAYDKKGLHTCHLCPKGAEWYETDYVVNDYNRGGTTLYHGYKCRECDNACVMKDFNQVSYMYNPSPGWVYTNVWSSGFRCPKCRCEGDSLGPEQEDFDF